MKKARISAATKEAIKVRVREALPTVITLLMVGLTFLCLNIIINVHEATIQQEAILETSLKVMAGEGTRAEQDVDLNLAAESPSSEDVTDADKQYVMRNIFDAYGFEGAFDDFGYGAISKLTNRSGSTRGYCVVYTDCIEFYETGTNSVEVTSFADPANLEYYSHELDEETYATLLEWCETYYQFQHGAADLSVITTSVVISPSDIYTLSNPTITTTNGRNYGLGVDKLN